MKAQQIKVLAVALCLTASFGAIAQKKEDKQKLNFKEKVAKLDANNDNFITKSEIKGDKNEKRILANWSAIDSNNDNRLSMQEIKAFRKDKNTKKGNSKN